MGVGIYKGAGVLTAPWGVAKRSLCTILRTGSKTSEYRFQMARALTAGDMWIFGLVSSSLCLTHVWRSLLISVQICIQSWGCLSRYTASHPRN